MKNPKIGAVIWDLDGTLLDSGGYHYEAERDALENYGVKINKAIYEKYLSTKIKDFVNEIIKKQESDAKAEEILNLISKKTIHNYLNNISLSIGVLQTLEEVKHKYVQALATAREKNVALIAVEKFDLEKFFDVMVFAEDVVNGKPDPEVFMLAASQLGIKPTNSLVIEDGLNGIKAANSAGMVSIARRAEHNQKVDFSSADYVIDEIGQVLDILKEY